MSGLDYVRLTPSIVTWSAMVRAKQNGILPTL